MNVFSDISKLINKQAFVQNYQNSITKMLIGQIHKWPIPKVGLVCGKMYGNIDGKRRKIVLFS